VDDLEGVLDDGGRELLLASVLVGLHQAVDESLDDGISDFWNCLLACRPIVWAIGVTVM